MENSQLDFIHYHPWTWGGSKKLKDAIDNNKLNTASEITLSDKQRIEAILYVLTSGKPSSLKAIMQTKPAWTNKDKNGYSLEYATLYHAINKYDGFASYEPNLDVIKNLVKSGASPNSKSPNGDNILNYAYTQSNWLKIADKLLGLGAKPDQGNSKHIPIAFELVLNTELPEKLSHLASKGLIVCGNNGEKLINSILNLQNNYYNEKVANEIKAKSISICIQNEASFNCKTYNTNSDIFKIALEDLAKNYVVKKLEKGNGGYLTYKELINKLSIPSKEHSK